VIRFFVRSTFALFDLGDVLAAVVAKIA